MNNRDPFGLRNPKLAPFTSVLRTSHARASAALQQTTTALSNVADNVANSVADTLSTAAHPPSTRSLPASDSMSFAVPRNVPNFAAPQRQFEDTATASWTGQSRARANGGSTAASGVADKIGGMFGEKGLPMYKDKPYQRQYGSGGGRGRWRRKRNIGIGAIVFLVLFWWMGWLSLGSGTGTESGKGVSSSSKSTEKGGWLWGKKEKVNWEWRRDRVRDAFELSWAAYEEHAWGFDEFHPVHKTGRQMAGSGLGWIIVDALDTLVMMNLTTQLVHAREWISTTLNYDIDHDVNTFETTIRMLGGLLSAHYLTTQFPNMAPIAMSEETGEDDLYLEKATDLADRLLGAYDSPTGIPYASVNLHTMKGIRSHTDGGSSSTAEATTLQLEMKYLALLTGEVSYWERAEAIMKAVDDIGAKDGLVPIFLNPDMGTFYGNNIRLGSRGDSYYEYLIKQYHQTSGQEPIYLDMWDEAMRGIRKHLITYSSPSGLTVLAERPDGLDGSLSAKMDHLVCFMPGTIALGATGGKTLEEAKKTGWTQKQEEDMELARQLTKTCWGMYKWPATGLAPEITYFHVADPPRMMRPGESPTQSPADLDPAEDADWRQDYDIHQADRHNLQRPETVESLFYMWRITGDIKYREWGWEMFQSFVKHTITEDGTGFSSIDDVTKIPPPSRDNMESFWLAETLKYFYLLFSPDDFLPLDQVVFNTEAHPFPRFELGKLFKTGWTRKPRDKDGNVPRDEKPKAPLKSLNDEQKQTIQKVLKEIQVEADDEARAEKEKEQGASLNAATGQIGAAAGALVR